jgi:hypothetical protein
MDTPLSSEEFFMDRTFFAGLAIAALLILVALPPARADEPYKIGTIEISQTWARATPAAAKAGAAYFTIHNTGSSEDTLTGISTAAAEQADIHQMSMSGDMMQMARVKGGLAIPAGGSVTLSPSGYHVMLTGLKGPLAQGKEISLTLAFAKAGTIEIKVPVEAIGANGPMAPAKGSDTTKDSMGGMKM